MSPLTPSQTTGTLGVTQLPDLTAAKALVRVPWKRVEVQGGRLRHRSASFPGAWSTSSVVIAGAVDLLLYVESYETGGCEYFSLRFGDVRDAWCSSHIKSARPAFSPVVSWPSDVQVPQELWSAGPIDGSLGLGSPISVVRAKEEGRIVPVLWCVFQFDGSELTVYADREISLNVGLASGGVGAHIRRSLRAAATVTL